MSSSEPAYGGMVRHKLASNTWQVQCPTCRKMVDATADVFDGVQPIMRHSKWAPSWVQLITARWPAPYRSRLLMQILVRAEWLARYLTRNYEPECLDKMPRFYRQWLPSGFGPMGPHIRQHNS